MDKTGNCFTYDIIDSICATFYIVSSGSTKYMEMAGGCYAGGEVAHYTPAKSNKQYKLEYIPIYVRSAYDPYVVYL